MTCLAELQLADVVSNPLCLMLMFLFHYHIYTAAIYGKVDQYYS